MPVIGQPPPFHPSFLTTTQTNEQYNHNMLINKYINEIKNIYHSSKVSFLFRGQENGWSLDSSAFRRIKKSEGFSNSITETDVDTIESFKDYNKDIIEKAKLKGYPKDFQKSSDLQILIELQHFGAATCLVDFTKNFLTALWFACQNNSNKRDGVVFVVNVENIKKITSYDLSKPIDEFLFNNDLWLWEPENINNRTLAQDSVCVFGAPILENHLSIQRIKIPSDDKSTLLYEMDTLFNVNYDTIYPDFYGFALSQAHTQPLQSLPPQPPIDYRIILSHMIKEGSWEYVKPILIDKHELLNNRIIIKLIENKIDIKEILENYKCKVKTCDAGIDPNVIAVRILADMFLDKGDDLMQYFNRLDKYWAQNWDIRPDYNGDLNTVDFFLASLFADSGTSLFDDTRKWDNVDEWDNDKFDVFKKFVIVFCKQESITKKLKSQLKDAILKSGVISDIQKRQIEPLFSEANI